MMSAMRGRRPAPPTPRTPTDGPTVLDISIERSCVQSLSDSSTVPRRPAHEVAVTLRAGDWRALDGDAAALCRRAARAAIAAAEHEAGDGRARRTTELSIVLADDALVGALNRDYRRRTGPTNVLAFPLSTGGERAAPAPGPLLLGDVVIAYETAAAEAAAADKTLADHLSHLVVHGVLHLFGYDHESEDEAAEMERLEAAALAALGVADPDPRGAAAGGRSRRRR